MCDVDDAGGFEDRLGDPQNRAVTRHHRERFTVLFQAVIGAVSDNREINVSDNRENNVSDNREIEVGDNIEFEVEYNTENDVDEKKRRFDVGDNSKHIHMGDNREVEVDDNRGKSREYYIHIVIDCKAVALLSN